MTQVNHTNFGLGTIISQDADNVTVDFNGTVKTLIIKFARLTNVDGTPFGVTFVAPKKKAKKLNPANFESAWNKIDHVATANNRARFNEEMRQAYMAETGRTGSLEFLKSL